MRQARSSPLPLKKRPCSRWTASANGQRRRSALDGAARSRSCDELRWPDSLGLLYSAFTYYTGFRVNSGEYKVMGLAPYGEPKYVDLILDELMDLRDDGSFRLNQKYFNYLTGLTMTSPAFDTLFGGPPRQPESQADAARNGPRPIGAGGVRGGHAADGADGAPADGPRQPLSRRRRGAELRGQRPPVARRAVRKLWIQPAAGDAGGALGVAQLIHHRHARHPRTVVANADSMKGSYLGPGVFRPRTSSATW